MARTVRVLVVLLLALSGAAAAVPALAAPASCSTPWGSTTDARDVGHGAPIVAIRAGSNACFDRLVFETDGPAGGFTVQYVDVVRQDGSGKPLVVPGGARLQVLLHSPSYDAAGNDTRSGTPDVTGFRTLRSVVDAAGFEGDSAFGVGTRGRLPFRAFTLPGPGSHARIVLDVAHDWR